MRVAVVGLGKMGLLHASLLNVLPNVQVAAVCDKSGMLRKFLRKVFSGVSMVDDVQKLSDLNLDAVYVTTPISSHFPIVKAVYLDRMARNLFVEKTLASSYDEAEELCKLSRGFGGVNMVGYVRRFAVPFRKVKELLAQKAVGELVSFNAYAYSSDFIESENGSGASASRGGVLQDLGCHVIDLALWFFGDLEVNRAKLTSPSGGDSVSFNVGGSGGLEGEFSVSWCVGEYRVPEVGFSISGSEGSIEVNDDKVELKLKNGESSSWRRHDLRDNVAFWLGAPEFFRENECFVKSVVDGSSTESSFQSASKVDQVIDQVKRGVGEGGG